MKITVRDLSRYYKFSVKMTRDKKNNLSSPAINQILNSGSVILRVEINEQLIVGLAFISCPWAICTAVAGICAGKHASLLKKAVWLINSHEFSQKITVNNLSQLWCIKYTVDLCRTFQWCLFYSDYMPVMGKPQSSAVPSKYIAMPSKRSGIVSYKLQRN